MDYQLQQTGPEVQGILNQAPEVVAVGNLNTINAVGNYYVTDGDGKARGYLICSQSGPAGSPFYLQTYLHDGAIYSRSGNALPLTGAWVNPMQDVANIKKVSAEELNGLINSSDNGLYYANLGGTTPALVQVYRDGAKAYQWLIEPHTGKIYVRDYNTQAATPAWSELVDAYADKQDTISDLSTIRSGAAAGATAVQPATMNTALAAKQDTISDLSTIRSGAAAGATAYQKPNTGIPKTDLASPVQTSLGKADTSVQPAALTPIQSAISVIEGLIPSAASAQNQLADKNYVDTHSSDIDVDDALSTTSENPVQNKVVTTALNGKQATISDLSTIRSGAAAGATAVQPATMNTALAAKQDTLTFDNAPTANSNNPVKSGGVKTAIDAKQDTISTVNVTVDNNTGTPSGSASVSGSTLSLSFQNLKGATGAQGPQGIQGVQGVQGPKGDTGVTGDASSLAIIHGIDKTSSYGTTDVCGADAAQALLNEIEGGFYY
jgi:hypothetical protein